MKVSLLLLMALLGATAHGRILEPEGDEGDTVQPDGLCFVDSDCVLWEECTAFSCTTRCFSGRSTVEVKDRGTVPMSALKIGDYVRVKDGAFSKVHGFGHYQPKIQAEFLQIQTASGMNQKEKPIEITTDHLLYKHDVITQKDQVVPAEKVRVGDYLIAAEGPTQITSIHKVQSHGAFAPLTTSGNVAVNGILASCYVSRHWVSEMVSGYALHLLQHGAATSHRIFCNWFQCEEETYDEATGFSPLVSFWFGLEQWQLEVTTIPRALFFMVLAPFALCVLLIGQFHIAPVLTFIHLIAALVGVSVWMQRSDKKKIKESHFQKKVRVD